MDLSILGWIEPRIHRTLDLSTLGSIDMDPANPTGVHALSVLLHSLWRDARYLRWLFPSHSAISLESWQRALDSRSTGTFKVGCRTLPHSTHGLPSQYFAFYNRFADSMTMKARVICHFSGHSSGEHGVTSATLM